MPKITSADLANQYQTLFTKTLLDHAVQELQLSQFSRPGELSKNLGAKTVRYFRRAPASAANVVALTEGVPLTEDQMSKHDLTPIDVTLSQMGEASKITDIVSMTALFNMLEIESSAMGEDCALYADTRTRDQIVADMLAATGAGLTGQERLPIGLANYAALVAASASAAAYTSHQGIDAVTKLKLRRARKIDGYYVGIVSPEIIGDLMLDDRWVTASKYGATTQLFKGEAGMLDGIRYVETTNPFRELDTKGTYNAAGPIVVSMFTGKDSYGTPSLAGTSPWKPKLMIVPPGTPDKADALAQYGTVGWKGFWGAKVLDPTWMVLLRNKYTFAG